MFIIAIPTLSCIVDRQLGRASEAGSGIESSMFVLPGSSNSLQKSQTSGAAFAGSGWKWGLSLEYIEIVSLCFFLQNVAQYITAICPGV